MNENEEKLSCELDNFGELRLDNKKYIVALTDVQQEVEAGRVRHKFVLTEII